MKLFAFLSVAGLSHAAHHEAIMAMANNQGKGSDNFSSYDPMKFMIFLRFVEKLICLKPFKKLEIRIQDLK